MTHQSRGERFFQGPLILAVVKHKRTRLLFVSAVVCIILIFASFHSIFKSTSLHSAQSVEQKLRDEYEQHNETKSLVDDFLETLSKRRKDIITQRERYIYGWDEQYFEKVNFPEKQVLTFKLEGAFDVVRQMYYQQYYRWTATKTVCKRLHIFNEAETDLLFMNSVCHSDLNSMFDKVNFNVLYVDSGPPFNMKDKARSVTSGKSLVTFIHLIQNGVALPGGNVRLGDTVISPRACTSNLDGKSTTLDKLQHVTREREVFVISQYWAENYFHSLVETLPRIVPYIAFLRQNPSILIHSEPTVYIKHALEMLDISPRRIVSGTVQSDVIYLPEGVRCAHAQTYNTQLLASTFIRHTRLLYPTDNRNLIVLIKRSAKRFFRYHLSIYEALKVLARETGTRVVVFDDRDLPKFHEMTRMFYNARLVVGAHGAGLSNIMFSQRGTFVIEALCFQPEPNLCFRRLAHILGHHYHAIGSEKESCLETTPDEIVEPARFFLTR